MAAEQVVEAEEERDRHRTGLFSLQVRPDDPQEVRWLIAAARFWPKVERAEGDGCWLWKGAVHQTGLPVFPKVGASADREASTFLSAARMAWELCNGKMPRHWQVRRACGNRLCVRPSHLKVGSGPLNPSAGVAVAVSAHRRKLTAEQVDAIRAVYATGKFTLQELGTTFGVTREMVRLIVAEKCWKPADDMIAASTTR